MIQDHFWFTFGPLFFVNAFIVVSLVVFIVISRHRPKTAEIEERHSSIILNKWIREFWMWLLEPIFRFFIFFHISPNAISITGCVVAIFSAAAFAVGHFGLGGWLMVLGASLDFFDGRVARATNRCTQAGSFIDSCLDRVSEGLTLTGLAFFYRDSFIFWVVMLAYLGSMLTSYTKAKGETMGVAYSGGMMQRPERIAYLGAGGILAPVFAYALFPLLFPRFPQLTLLGLVGYVYLIPLFFVTVLSNVAALNRMINIMRILDKQKVTGSKM
ncbi:MAG TPA: CDP-alcohol phosphatidyltransferase family protein [bacterium]|nr:CDP-alcohol phosphatidyltransferase family protein [bacterium]